MRHEKIVVSQNLLKEKEPIKEQSVDGGKSALPRQHEVATQTALRRGTGSDASFRHQCRHFVEVKVPNSEDDFVVNITKSRPPPPPYCEINT